MMQNVNKLKKQVEQIAARAWPAEIIKQYGTWQVRMHKGVTKRANSVLTIGPPSENDDWLTKLEAIYEREKITPCFYITESTTSEVERVLLQNGYERDTDIAILSVASKELVDHIQVDNQFEVQKEAEVSPEWMTSFLSLEGHDEKDRQAYEKIFTNIQLNKSFVSLRLAGEIVAVATIAAERNWGYVSNVVVNKEYRRHGIASQLLRHLAAWAQEHETEHLFMQVLANNTPALHLYEKHGFTNLTNSYYMTKTN